MELTERLAEARKARGLSQAEAAERLGVSRQAISRWETGAGTPSLDSLLQMGQLYQASLDELVYGAEAAQPRKEEDEEEAEPKAQPEPPAAQAPHRRRTALLAAVLALAAAGILALGIWIGFGVAGAGEATEISWDDLVIKEHINPGEEFDLVPWE